MSVQQEEIQVKNLRHALTALDQLLEQDRSDDERLVLSLAIGIVQDELEQMDSV